MQQHHKARAVSWVTEHSIECRNIQVILLISLTFQYWNYCIWIFFDMIMIESECLQVIGEAFPAHMAEKIMLGLKVEIKIIFFTILIKERIVLDLNLASYSSFSVYWEQLPLLGNISSTEKVIWVGGWTGWTWNAWFCCCLLLWYCWIHRTLWSIKPWKGKYRFYNDAYFSKNFMYQTDKKIELWYKHVCLDSWSIFRRDKVSNYVWLAFLCKIGLSEWFCNQLCINSSWFK